MILLRRTAMVAAVFLGTVGSTSAATLIGHVPLDSAGAGGTPEVSGAGAPFVCRLSGDAAIVDDIERGRVLRTGGAGFVDCGNSPRLPASGAFSVSLWMRAHAWDRPWQTVVGKGEDWGLHRPDIYNNLQFYAGNLSDAPWADMRAHPEDGAWHHVVAVYTGRAMHVWFDGIWRGSEVTGIRSSTTSPLRIGDVAGQTDRGFVGLIDDVRLYAGALDGDDVAALWRGDDPRRAEPVAPPAGGLLPQDGTAVTLQWRAAPAATAYEVYAGTDRDQVGQATPATPTLFRGRQTGLTRSLPVRADRTYWWRVDAVRPEGVVRGAVTGFTIGNAKPHDHLDIPPAFVDEPLSSVYRVTVNGVAVPVQRYTARRSPGWGASDTPRSIAIARFAFAGRARIEVGIAGGVPAMWTLSPESRQIPVAEAGDTLRFSLDRPEKLMLHWGGWYGLDRAAGLDERLILIADPLESDAPSRTGPGVVDLGRRGVDRTGRTFVGRQIQAAIDAAAEVGGGTVYVPAGTYNIDRHLLMRSNVRLHLADGAVLRATTVRLDVSKGLIHMAGIENASITGRGLINRNGSRFRNDSFDAKDYDHAVVVWMDDCDDCRIDDIQLRDPSTVGVFVLGSRNVAVRGLVSVTDADFPNAHGLLVNDDSWDVVFDDVFTHDTDDSSAPGYWKSMGRFTVSNAVSNNTHNGRLIAVGSETAPLVGPILYENIDTIHTMGGIHLWSGLSEGVLRGIAIRGIRIEAAPVTTIKINVGGDAGGTGGRGSIENVLLQNVGFDGFGAAYWGGPRAEILGASAAHPIRGLTFDDVRLAGRHLRGADDLRWAGFTLNGFTQTGFAASDVAVVGIRAVDLYRREGQTARFVIGRRDGALGPALTIPYRLAGSATPEADYPTPSGTFTLAVGEREAELVVPLTADGLAEGVEQIRVVLQPQRGQRQWLVGPAYSAQIAIRD